MARSHHWMKKAFANARGQLHKKTGTPMGEKIPEKKIEAAANSNNATTQHQAQAALNARGAMHNRYGDKTVRKGA